MIKKIFGINETGEKIELNFKKYLLITDNNSTLELDTDVQKHPEGADLALNIYTGPMVELPSESNTCKKFKAVEGHRYFNVLPGASNLLFIKVVRKNTSLKVKRKPGVF